MSVTLFVLLPMANIFVKLRYFFAIFFLQAVSVSAGLKLSILGRWSECYTFCAITDGRYFCKANKFLPFYLSKQFLWLLDSNPRSLEDDVSVTLFELLLMADIFVKFLCQLDSNPQSWEGEASVILFVLLPMADIFVKLRYFLPFSLFKWLLCQLDLNPW